MTPQDKHEEQKLNETIARYFGWHSESEFHPDNPEEWSGWRDPQNRAGYSSVPNYVVILKHLVPAVEDLLANY